MDSELFEIVIPSILFFIGFFLTFSLIELFIILLLNGWVFKHWGFVVDVVIRVKVRHGRLIRFVTPASIVIFLGLLIKYTAVINILMSASMEEKLYAAQILLLIFLVYIRSTRHLVEITILRQIHKYLFIYFSAVVYVAVILVINTQYKNYQQLTNATIIHPITEKTQVILENYKRKQLLNEFRRQIHNDRCPRVDYTLELKKGNTKHFVYVTTDPDLAISYGTPLEDETQNYTVGRACTYANETFLLTDDGRWFWIIDT